MSRTPNRRGSAAVEFAFTAPILLFMASIVVDYGWFMNRQATLIQAVRQGTRVASRVKQMDGPATEAVTATSAALAQYGIPCDVAACEVSATLDVAGDMLLVVVDVQLDYQPIIGLVPIPDAQAYRFSMALDDQGLIEG